MPKTSMPCSHFIDTSFKNCDRWRMQQKIMWAEIRKKTGRGKNRFTIREMFADERCTGAVLDFLRTTRVGARTGPPDPGGEREKEVHSLLSYLFLSVTRSFLFLSSFLLSFSLTFVSWDRPGGGRGSRREPLADCSRAQRTANGKGLYIISS